MISCTNGRVEISGDIVQLTAELHILLKGLIQSNIMSVDMIDSVWALVKCELDENDRSEAFDDVVIAMIDKFIKYKTDTSSKEDIEPLSMDEDVMRMVFEGVKG